MAQDVVLYSSEASAVSVLPNDGDGALQPRIDYGAPTVSFPARLAVADVTGDGKADILISGGSMFVATCLP